MAEDPMKDFSDRLERLESILGLQTLPSDEINVRRVAGDGHSTQSINCNSVRSCASLICAAEDVAGRRI
jgi:hypothetical protein